MNARFPSMQSVTLTNANTQYSLVLPRGTKRYELFTNHASGAFRFAYETGKVAGPTEPYYNVPNGFVFNVDGLDFTDPVTIYLASDTAGLIVNVHYWV